jgi:cytochrome c oxidase assembly factor 2
MPPHLHPRSTATSTLFAATLLTSFIVVGIPHVFPCPAPRKGYSDSPRQIRDADGNIIAAKENALSSKHQSTSQPSCSKSLQEEAQVFKMLQQEAETLEKEARECPVPKPRGFVGRILGFQEQKQSMVETTKPKS